jgi:hypothetical protein
MKMPLEPAEYEIVQGVFKRLVQAPWFDRTAPHEKECAKLVLQQYSAGAEDPEDLLAACEPDARQRYGVADENRTHSEPSNAGALREDDR